MARFFIDENLPRSLKPALVAAGLDAEDVRDTHLRGRPDDELVEHATTQRMVLITRDIGIGNVQTYPLGTHGGIVLIRFPNEVSATDVDNAIVSALRLIPDADLMGNLVVLDTHKLRIRRKP